MKTLSVACALIIVLVIAIMSCCPVDDTAARNKAVALKAFEVLNNGDYDALDELVASNYKRHCQATPDIAIESLEQFKEFVKSWEDAFPDMKAELHHIIAEGDMVAAYLTYTGTNSGAMGNIPATGKLMDSKTFVLHRFENGKIAESWVTWDNVAILNQLGLFPPAAAGGGE
ncbi:MAG: ester cyclase [candidate division Zixibacteria bacterium]|nr:ester cyclase [candidate division Zixibacteria bacterium]